MELEAPKQYLNVDGAIISPEDPPVYRRWPLMGTVVAFLLIAVVGLGFSDATGAMPLGRKPTIALTKALTPSEAAFHVDVGHRPGKPDVRDATARAAARAAVQAPTKSAHPSAAGQVDAAAHERARMHSRHRPSRARHSEAKGTNGANSNTDWPAWAPALDPNVGETHANAYFQNLHSAHEVPEVQDLRSASPSPSHHFTESQAQPWDAHLDLNSDAMVAVPNWQSNSQAEEALSANSYSKEAWHASANLETAVSPGQTPFKPHFDPDSVMVAGPNGHANSPLRERHEQAYGHAKSQAESPGQISFKDRHQQAWHASSQGKESWHANSQAGTSRESAVSPLQTPFSPPGHAHRAEYGERDQSHGRSPMRTEQFSEHTEPSHGRSPARTVRTEQSLNQQPLNQLRSPARTARTEQSLSPSHRENPPAPKTRVQAPLHQQSSPQIPEHIEEVDVEVVQLPQKSPSESLQSSKEASAEYFSGASLKSASKTLVDVRKLLRNWSELATNRMRSANAALPPTAGFDPLLKPGMFSDLMLIEKIQKDLEWTIHDHHVLGLSVGKATEDKEDNIQALASVSLQTRYEWQGSAKMLQNLAKEQGWKLNLPQVPVAYIDAIVTTPHEKKQGVERELVLGIIEWAKEQGRLLEVSVAREEEAKFYESLGFRRIDIHGEPCMLYLGRQQNDRLDRAGGGQQQQQQELPQHQQPETSQQNDFYGDYLKSKQLQQQQQLPPPSALQQYQEQQQSQREEGSVLLDFDLVLSWQEQSKVPPPPNPHAWPPTHHAGPTIRGGI